MLCIAVAIVHYLSMFCQLLLPVIPLFIRLNPKLNYKLFAVTTSVFIFLPASIIEDFNSLVREPQT